MFAVYFLRGLADALVRIAEAGIAFGLTVGIVAAIWKARRGVRIAPEDRQPRLMEKKGGGGPGPGPSSPDR